MRKPVHDHKIVTLLNDKGPLNAVEIGKELNIKNGFVYSVLDRMRKQGFISRNAAKKYFVKSSKSHVNMSSSMREIKPEEATPVLDVYVEVLLGEVESINKRLEDLLLIKVHLINRINAHKDATARSARKN